MTFALKHAEQLPAAVRSMLSHTVAENLGCKKADRHPHQQKFVDMMAEALTGLDASLKTAVQVTDAKVVSTEAEKTTRTAAETAAKAEMDTATAAVDAKKTEIGEKKAAVDAAESEHDAAVAAAKALTKKIEVDGAKLETLKKFKEEWPALKEAATDKATAKKALKAVSGCGIEEFVVDSMPAALTAGPAGRSTFENFAMKGFEEELAAIVTTLESTKAEEEAAKATTDGSVGTTETALTAAKEALEAAKKELVELQGASKEKAATLKTASKAVESFESEMKAATDASALAKKKLTGYEEGAKKAFAELDALTDETPGFVMKTIGGVKVDEGILTLCKNAAASGAITPEKLAQIKHFGELSPAARWAIRYSLTDFTWTEAAHDLVVDLTTAVNVEPEEKKRKTKGYYQMLDGVKVDSGIVEACQLAVSGEGDGRVSVEDAKKVFEKVIDGGKVTTAEIWTIRYSLSAFKWTGAAKTWLHEAMEALKKK